MARYFVILGLAGSPEATLDHIEAKHGGALGNAVLFSSPAGEATYGAIEVVPPSETAKDTLPSPEGIPQPPKETP